MAIPTRHDRRRLAKLERRGLEPSEPEPDRIVRTAEAERLSGYTSVHLRRLELAGRFPKRFKLSDAGGPFGAAGWKLSEILGWIEERAASRNGSAS